VHTVNALRATTNVSGAEMEERMFPEEEEHVFGQNFEMKFVDVRTL